jgi:hypothetical protein
MSGWVPFLHKNSKNQHGWYKRPLLDTIPDQLHPTPTLTTYLRNNILVSYPLTRFTNFQVTVFQVVHPPKSYKHSMKMWVSLQTKQNSCYWINPLKPKLVHIIFNNSVRTPEKTPVLTIKNVEWLTLFKEIIPDYIENHTKHMNTKWTAAVKLGCT